MSQLPGRTRIEVMGAASSNRILFLNVLAFTICFAAWTMYGVLGAFLTDNRILTLDRAQLGWLIGTPLLTGSILRLPLGVLTDRYGGKPMYIITMLVSAVHAMFTADQFDKIAKALPLRKLGRPRDVANAVVFLASDAAGHITGQVLSVSGGYSMIG